MKTRSQRFTGALAAARAVGLAPVVAEVKCISPKQGDLLRGRGPAVLARSMQDAGAACISVVTEPEHFGGSLELLQTIRSAVSIPVLRKDFIRTGDEVRRTADAGADCMLLIVSMLEWELLAQLHELAHTLGLETLVEVHDALELQKALTLDLDLLGINNRDITRLERDEGNVDRTLDLMRQVPVGLNVISESGLGSVEDVRLVLQAGAAGVLIGTSILQQDDAGSAVARLVGATGDK